MPLKLENSSCCAGLKQFQILRSASLKTFAQKAQDCYKIFFEGRVFPGGSLRKSSAAGWYPITPNRLKEIRIILPRAAFVYFNLKLLFL
jgi:hypothetical protein